MKCNLTMLLCLVMLLFLQPTSLQATHPYHVKQEARKNNNHQQIVEGVVIVKFKEQPTISTNGIKTNYETLNQKITKHNIRHIKAIFPQARQSAKRKASELSKIYFFQFDEQQDERQIARDFSREAAVEYAEPKYMYFTTESPNDTRYLDMPQFARVNAEAAWEIVKGEDGDVVVAVVDGGIDWDHPDLQANIWANTDEMAGNGIDDDGNGFVDDVRGWGFHTNSADPTGPFPFHGTHVSGTVSAVSDNTTGVAGMAWNCKIMPVGAGSPTNSNAILYGYEGITYAVENNADIVNCSWGGEGSSSSFEQEIVDFARENGTLIVAAAGNSSVNMDAQPHFPSAYEGVLSVGATSKTNDARSAIAGSNFGITVDVFAPGEAILSTTPGGGYGEISGTSMASPMAAGLVALIKTQNPDLTPDQLRGQIRMTADNIDGSNNAGVQGLLGRGRMNALRAVSEFDHPFLEINRVDFTETSGNNDGIIDAGETIKLTIEFVNHLATAENINVELTSLLDNATPTNANSFFLRIEGGQIITIGNLEFRVSSAAQDNEALRFAITFSNEDTGYEDKDVFGLTVTPPDFVTHETDALKVSITNTGNIGYAGFAEETPGEGFQVNGLNYLFEGGLMVAVNPGQISDCVRQSGGASEVDFKAFEDEALSITSPAEFAFQQTRLSLHDSLADFPIGISISQESFVDTALYHDQYVVMKYEIRNDNAFAISDVHVGLFFDWDISDDFNDDARYDADRRMGYALDDANNPTRIAATKLLTRFTPIHYRSIDNPTELYDDFTVNEKWNFMTDSIQRQNLTNVDVSTITSTGPFNIPSGESITIGFAIIGVETLDDLFIGADVAQNFWDTNIDPAVGIGNQPIVPNQLNLQLAPNPFAEELQLTYHLTNTENVNVQIYDLQGKLIQQFNQGKQGAGTHQIMWNRLDSTGNRVSTGHYFVQLQAGNQSVSRKILVVD